MPSLVSQKTNRHTRRFEFLSFQKYVRVHRRNRSSLTAFTVVLKRCYCVHSLQYNMQPWSLSARTDLAVQNSNLCCFACPQLNRKCWAAQWSVEFLLFETSKLVHIFIHFIMWFWEIWWSTSWEGLIHDVATIGEWGERCDEIVIRCLKLWLPVDYPTRIYHWCELMQELILQQGTLPFAHWMNIFQAGNSFHLRKKPLSTWSATHMLLRELSYWYVW